MKDLAGRVAVVTGASRGLGARIAAALARRGMKLALTGRSADELARVTGSMTARGTAAIAIPADLTEPAACDRLIAETVRVFGGVDLLVNNAGVFAASAYDQIPLEALNEHIAVNLTAPMRLTRLALPLMLARNRGHIVNISSLAGLIGIGWSEPYGAAKHGLVGFTRSLRASCRSFGSRVSASVVCPGYVDDVGMYSDRVRAHGDGASRLIGTSAPDAVVAAVIRAVERDLPEVIVCPRPIRVLLTMNAMSPRAAEWVGRKLRIHAVFEGFARTSESR